MNECVWHFGWLGGMAGSLAAEQRYSQNDCIFLLIALRPNNKPSTNNSKASISVGRKKRQGRKQNIHNTKRLQHCKGIHAKLFCCELFCFYLEKRNARIQSRVSECRLLRILLPFITHFCFLFKRDKWLCICLECECAVHWNVLWSLINFDCVSIN